jgi:hypothetical protein
MKILFAAAGATALLIWLFYKLRNVTTRTVTMSEAVSLRKDNLLCPVCGKVMTAGFSAAPRGIFFRKTVEKPFGTFIPPWNAMVNTLNTGLTPRENVAWRCAPCNLLLINHSASVKRNKQ